MNQNLDKNLFGHLLVQLHKVVLHSKVEQALGGVLVQLVVPVHVPRQPRQGRDLLLGARSLRKNIQLTETKKAKRGAELNKWIRISMHDSVVAI